MKDKVAIITGASAGIGRAVALKMAQKGAKLVLIDINEQGLIALKKELDLFNTESLLFAIDVTDEELVNKAVLDAVSHFGKIDILINNAGIWRYFEQFINIPTEKWQTFFHTNVFSMVYLTKAVIPIMKKNSYGRIVNLASVAGVYGNANMSMYSATKGAIISFTKALAKEVITDGIVVNCVSPGTVSPSDNLDVNYYEQTDRCYAGRTGTADENADLICFLASKDVGYIVGQNILIDGSRKMV